MRILCWYCHKRCSNELPEDTIVRAIAVCPECIAKSPEGNNLKIDDESDATELLELERSKVAFLEKIINKMKVQNLNNTEVISSSDCVYARGCRDFHNGKPAI